MRSVDVRDQEVNATPTRARASLLDTLDTQVDAKNCPGVCMHSLATLICSQVLDEVECPNPSMKCCVDEPIEWSDVFWSPGSNPESVTSDGMTHIGHSKNKKRKHAFKHGDDDVMVLGCSSRHDVVPLDRIEGNTHRVIYVDRLVRYTGVLGNDTAITTRKPFTTRYTTTEADEDDTTLAPAHKYADKHTDSANKACPGVCVAERIAAYCEAYLAADGLCTAGLRCCVSKDSFLDRAPPAKVVPNEKLATKRPPPTPLTTTTPSPTKNQGHTCRGDCISGLFLLLCEHVDEEATCPDEGTCCVNEPRPADHRRPAATTTTTRAPPPRHTTHTPLPRCPGYCLLGIMAAFCERPAALLPHTSCKLSGSICCDNTRVPPRTTPRPTTTTTTVAPAPVDPRPDCPGSCIVSLLSFTCFRNAEMTDVFKCKKAGTQCCAPKAKVAEALGARPDNDSYPLPASAPYHHAPPTAPPLPPTQPYTTQLAPYEPNYGSTLKAPEKYSKYVCGVKGSAEEGAGAREGRVMGGADGARGEWCWQVALINSLNQYLCGAALVGTQWVLTAAHCVTNIVRSGDAMYVRVGDHDLTRKHGSPGAQTLRVATTYIHHNHNSQTLDNDIALLKLHGKAELKAGVCLVCLPARGVSHAAGKRCTVTGYGYMGEISRVAHTSYNGAFWHTAGPIPLRVREAELPIVSDAECIRKVNAVTEKIFILPASSFCAGGEEGHDACQGDGGGPLVCQDDGFYELVGLVSWGFGCGRKDVPGVYVKVITLTFMPFGVVVHRLDKPDHQREQPLTPSLRVSRWPQSQCIYGCGHSVTVETQTNRRDSNQ
ncbi:Protein masquerade [Eumeta japonica]|uniref:Protein masquerade n=1 Tax=Eumeta variegata TaxID=151549 RepID=A0A4C1Z0K7_EUMVA|nr:Protein masquerade [Eumeta japonica]